METRSAIPYISHLRLTKRPTKRWQATGFRDPRSGDDLYQQITDLPGIEVEITPYMGNVKGPAQQFRFPLRAFFAEALAEFQGIEHPTTEQLKAIANLQATLARTDVTWAEAIVEAGELPPLLDLWQSVFSDALDEFPSWEESNSLGGIPIEIREMQWDARFPSDGAKSIDLKVGIFCGQADPEVYTLSFEDQQTRQQRVAYDSQVETEITRLVAAIAAAQEDDERTQLEQQLVYRQTEQAQRAAIERGVMSELLSKPAVQASLPGLLLAILSALKQTQWPELDMALVQERLVASLGDLN